MPARNRQPGAPAVEELQKKVATPQSERKLLWWYEVGEQVALFHPPGEREYGRERMPHLAKTLGGEPSANNLFKARQFAGTYTRPEVRELSKPKKSGYALTWSHAQTLIFLEPDDRVKMQAKCLEHEWSTRELQRQTKALGGSKGKGGRKYEKPADLESALRQLIAESRDWIRRYDEVWFEGEDPAIHAEGKKPSSEVRMLVAEAAQLLKTLQSKAATGLQEIEALVLPKKRENR